MKRDFRCVGPTRYRPRMASPADQERQFRQVYERTYGPINVYARRRVERDDVEDVVSETFAVAWRRIDAIPTDMALPWLYGVARRVIAQRHRSRRRWQRLVLRAGAMTISTDQLQPPSES